MKDFSHITNRLILILLGSTVCACVVVPKKVASYDKNCMVSTQKIELTIEQMEVFDDVDCFNNNCRAQLVGVLATSTLVTTTSAIVSGSIALIGNTLYWAESQGKCPNLIKQDKNLPKTQRDDTDDTYIIKEEVISAKF